MPLTPRDYQAACLKAHITYFQKRRGNPIFVMPTGSGKSLVIAEFCRTTVERWPNQRIIILTHVKELVEQNYNEFIGQWGLLAPVGIYSAGMGRRDTDCSVIFAGIQSVWHRLNEPSEAAKRLGKFDLVLIDECHMLPKSGEGRYRNYIKWLREQNPATKVIGYTATPFRLEGGLLHQGEGRIFTDIAYNVDLEKLIEDGHLAPLVAKKPRGGVIDTSSVGTLAGDFKKGELELAAMLGNTVPDAVDEMLRVAEEEERKHWLVFACGVDHAMSILAELEKHGVNAQAIFGDTNKEDRARIVADAKAGKITALVNVGVLTTGFNWTRCDMIAVMRSTKSTALYCLDSETEILTSRGWVGHGDAMVGDRALAWHDGGAGAWSRVTAVVDRPMDDAESWVSYDAPRANFRVTDQHRMIYQTGVFTPKGDTKKWSEWKFGTASEMQGHRNGVRVPTAVMIDQPGVPLTDDEIYLVGIIMSDGSITTHQVTIYQSERYPLVMSRIEAALDGARIRYRKARIKAKTQYQENYPRWRYSISAGEPKREKGLRGIRYLYPWIDKGLSPALMSLSRSQFIVLIDAIWDGDGSKLENVDYTPRSKTICTAREQAADRLQALGVMHGHTVNLRWDHGKSRKNPIAVLTFTDKNWRSIGGSGNRPQISLSDSTNEKVWCVETEHGTIVTRRRGKVTVMGNCQIMGRGMRTHEGKVDCLVLDYGGNVERHGPINRVAVDNSGKGAAPMKSCPECDLYVAAGTKTCPDCGHVFFDTVEREAKHAARASLAKPIDFTPVIVKPEFFDCQGVRYGRHTKEGKPDSLRVSYTCGMRSFSEWVCIEHTGFARRKAEQWWEKRSPGTRVPDSVDEALDRQHELPTPTQVIVKEEGKYDRIVGTTWRRPAESEGSDQGAAADFGTGTAGRPW